MVTLVGRRDGGTEWDGTGLGREWDMRMENELVPLRLRWLRSRAIQPVFALGAAVAPSPPPASSASLLWSACLFSRIVRVLRLKTPALF